MRYSDAKALVHGGRVCGTYETADGTRIGVTNQRLHEVLARLLTNGCTEEGLAAIFLGDFSPGEKNAAAEIIGIRYEVIDGRVIILQE